VPGAIAALGPEELQFSPDGSRLAFVGRAGPTARDYRLYVADADGSNPVPVVRSDDRPGIFAQHLAWSPNGEEIAYVDQAPTDEHALKVVDVAAGTARTVDGLVETAAGPYQWPLFSWAPGNDAILLSWTGEPRAYGLWSVAADGSGRTPLVERAVSGALQPVPSAP
jgi:Tol biopolymer transport system component